MIWPFLVFSDAAVHASLGQIAICRLHCFACTFFYLCFLSVNCLQRPPNFVPIMFFAVFFCTMIFLCIRIILGEPYGGFNLGAGPNN